MTKKLRVGLIFGGRSGEHEVSVASALSVYKALDQSRYDVTLLAIDKNGRWRLPDAKTLLAQAERSSMVTSVAETGASLTPVPYPNTEQLVALDTTSNGLPHLDIVIPILHGTYGEDGTMQGLLELAQVPYVGSGVLGSALGMDKEVARRLLSASGISTVPTVCVRKLEFKKDPQSCEKKIASALAFPFFVKPSNAGSSLGVHKVKRAEDLRAALVDAFLYDNKVLAEKAIDARELECSVLGNEEPRTSVVGEVISHREFYDYEAKYLDENAVEFHIPAKNLPDETVKKLQAWAAKAFTLLECQGMARVDFFLDKKTGELYLNEINTIPGFTRFSMYPKMWEASGLAYPALLDELIRLALENFASRRDLKTSRE